MLSSGTLRLQATHSFSDFSRYNQHWLCRGDTWGSSHDLPSLFACLGVAKLASAVEILHIRCNHVLKCSLLGYPTYSCLAAQGVCKNGCKSICHVNGTFRWSSVRSWFFEYCSQPTSFERAEWPFDLGKSRRSLCNAILLKICLLEGLELLLFPRSLSQPDSAAVAGFLTQRQLRQFHPLIVFVVAPRKSIWRWSWDCRCYPTLIQIAFCHCEAAILTLQVM